MQDDRSVAKKVQEMYPDVDFHTILGLCQEMREVDQVIDYLQKNPNGGWSTTESKTRTQTGDKLKQRPQRERRIPKKPGDKQEPPKETTEQAAPVPVKKQMNFGKPSGASWGSLKLDDKAEGPQTDSAAPPAKQAPAKQAPANPPQAKPAPAPPQVKPVEEKEVVREPVKETPPQPKPEPTPKPEPAQKPDTALYIPKSLERVTPQMSKFGVFTGPVRRTPPPETPQEVPPKRRMEVSTELVVHEVPLQVQQPAPVQQAPPQAPPQPQPQPQQAPVQPQQEEEIRKEGAQVPFWYPSYPGWFPYMQPGQWPMDMEAGPYGMMRPPAQGQPDDRARPHPQGQMPPGFPAMPPGFMGMPYAMPPPAGQQFPPRGDYRQFQRGDYNPQAGYPRPY